MKLNSLPAYAHQTETTDFILKNPRCLITSDPGTGKTRSVLDAHHSLDATTLVIAPLSILEAAWVDDIKKFQPTINYGVAYARNRSKVFADPQYNMVITNFEAVNYLYKNPQVLERFDTLVVDEFTAFKNKDSKRSKHLKQIVSCFDNRIFMSGTPNTNSILDVWHPVLCVDDGKRLGERYYSFRNQVCTPRFNGFANEWVDKPGIEQTVAQLLSDINIRHALEDCIDLPDNVTRIMHTDLTPAVKAMYDTLAEESVLYTQQGTINGETPAHKRVDIVERFQAGQIKVLFAHPQSAGHGLTLTKATTCIWCSPTYNAEHFQQFNRRIHRSGQTNKTETILIAARDTWEETVYEKLDGKLGKMENLLQVLNKLHNQEESNE